jgi:hypothetical protein
MPLLVPSKSPEFEPSQVPAHYAVVMVANDEGQKDWDQLLLVLQLLVLTLVRSPEGSNQEDGSV